MTIPYIILVLGAISLTIFLMLRDKRGSIEALMLKTITSFLFITLAFASFMVNQATENITFYMLISMGLVCGLIGDIVLDLKIIYKESSSKYQFAGMTAFLIGHIFYLTALFMYFGFHWLPLVIAIVLAIATILTSLKIFKFKFKEHTVHTVLYSFALSYMMTQACYAAITTGFTAPTVLLAIGGILFLASDLVLVMTYYNNKDSKAYISINHILYYFAQFIIALSILYL